MKKIQILILIAFMCAFGISTSSGQSNLTLYNMKTIPQRINSNPALMSDAKNFLGFPVISSQYFAFGNNAFSGNSLLSLVEPITPDSSIIDLSRLESIFEKTNYISLEYNVDLLSFGFRVKKRNYVYVTSTLHNQFRFSYPGDFFALLSQGNGGKNINREFNLAFGVDMLQYADVGLGYSRKLLKDKLTVGARYRVLKGLNVINTERNDMRFRTNPNTYDLTVQSDIKINAASSLIQVNGLDFFNSFDSNSINQDNLFNKINTGWALDFGADYKLNSKITLSASINNIGKINWNTNTFNVKSKTPGATYTYEGIHFDDMFDENGTNTEEAIQKIADTLVERFRLENTTGEAFSTGLFAEFYVGANYHLSRNHNAGALIYGSFYQQRIYPSLTLSWNSKLTSIFALSATYTILPNSFFNAGLGFSLNGGPFQIYAVSDNIGGLLAPNDVKNLNFRVGFNLTMQRKDIEAKAARDAKKAQKKADKGKK